MIFLSALCVLCGEKLAGTLAEAGPDDIDQHENCGNGSRHGRLLVKRVKASPAAKTVFFWVPKRTRLVMVCGATFNKRPRPSIPSPR